MPRPPFLRRPAEPPGRRPFALRITPRRDSARAVKLPSRQQAQLAYLQTLPPKFQRIHSVIEQMAALQADDVTARGLARLLDDIKGNAGALSLSGLADTA